jgi:protein gp37
MSTQSKIEWTDSTWNPTRGCSIVSPGCTNCYAMKQAHRFSGKGGAYAGLTKLARGGPVWTGEVRTVPAALTEPLRWRTPRRVFVDSMSDLFHKDVPVTFIDEVFGVMAVASAAFHGPGDGAPKRGHWTSFDGTKVQTRWPNHKHGPHEFQLLTKRADRMLEYLCGAQLRVAAAAYRHAHNRRTAGALAEAIESRELWPLPNVWLGVSVEDQQRAHERIPLLLKAPAAVRFLSCEPLLGPVDLAEIAELHGGTAECCDEPSCDYCAGTGERTEAGLHWIIVGGESGPGARPFNLAWARSLVEQCESAEVPCFVKQLGARPYLHTSSSAETTGPGYSLRVASLEVDTTIELRDRKGGDWSEWPSDLRVREFPR